MAKFFIVVAVLAALAAGLSFVLDQGRPPFALSLETPETKAGEIGLVFEGEGEARRMSGSTTVNVALVNRSNSPCRVVGVGHESC